MKETVFEKFTKICNYKGCNNRERKWKEDSIRMGRLEII